MYSIIPSELSIKLVNNDDSETCDRIGELIYRYIPLTGINVILGFSDFKAALVNEIIGASDNIEHIADIAIKICEPYLKYEIPHNVGDQYTNFMNPNQNLIPYLQIKKFSKEIYDNTSYLSELKSLLVSSYFYTKSKKKLKLSQLTSLYGAKLNDSSTADRILYDKMHKIYQSIKNTNFSITASSLATFLEHDPISEKFFFDSCYDSEIFLGLIHSSVKSKNPFIDSLKKTNLNKFLDCFHDININKNNRINSPSFIKELFMNEHGVNENIFQLYNNFFLERLTNVNFINRLYSIQKKFDFSQENILPLIEFTNSPLLQFRLKILNLYEENYISYFKYNPLFLPEWNRYLSNILLHQLVCTLPIIDLVFHYLMYLRNSKLNKAHKFGEKSQFSQSVCTYFKKLASNKSSYFFDYGKNNDYIPTPCLYKSPKNVLDKTYTDLSNAVFENLIYKTKNLSENENLLAKLDVIHDMQQDFLQQALLNSAINSSIKMLKV